MQDTSAQLIIRLWVSLSQLVNPSGCSHDVSEKRLLLNSASNSARTVELEASKRGAPVAARSGTILASRHLKDARKLDGYVRVVTAHVW